MKTMLRTLFGGAIAAALLTGCAGYGPSALTPGASVDQARQSLGEPTAVYPLEDKGRRFEYARGPFGRHTYMLDFDGDGRLVKWEQVLHEQNFNQITPGMPAREVLMRIGQSFDQRLVGVAERRQTVWAYRYETPFCQYFQVGIDSYGKVMDTSYGPDPVCEVETGDVL